MTILIMFIVISIAAALIFLGFFIWSFRSGQYDDTDTPSIRMLFESGKEKRNSHEKP